MNQSLSPDQFVRLFVGLFVACLVPQLEGKSLGWFVPGRSVLR